MNAVTYAESVLGVHVVHDEALQEYDGFVNAQRRLEQTNSVIRSVKDEIEDREAEVIAAEGPATAGLSATAAKAHMKSAIDADPQCRDLRSRLHELEADRALHERDIAIHRMGVELRVARMLELGGLLQFYAAAKTAQGSATPQVTSS